MPISDNELIRELVTGGMDERAAKALLTRLSAASRATWWLDCDITTGNGGWPAQITDGLEFSVPMVDADHAAIQGNPVSMSASVFAFVEPGGTVCRKPFVSAPAAMPAGQSLQLFSVSISSLAGTEAIWIVGQDPSTMPLVPGDFLGIDASNVSVQAQVGADLVTSFGSAVEWLTSVAGGMFLVTMTVIPSPLSA